jgi:arylsulfatase A-like enzyme
MDDETHCTTGERDVDTEDIYWGGQTLGTRMPEATKGIMCRTEDFKYVRRVYEDDELYDLRSDPHELRNLVHDPAAQETLSKMKERLLDFLARTTDVIPFTRDSRGN